MESLGHMLNRKLRQWRPTTSKEVRELVTEIMKRADEDALDLSRSRSAEQEVLDAIDEPQPR